MSNDTDQTSPRRVRVMLPWALAVLFFIVLSGLVAAMVVGLTMEPATELALAEVPGVAAMEAPPAPPPETTETPSPDPDLPANSPVALLDDPSEAVPTKATPTEPAPAELPAPQESTAPEAPRAAGGVVSEEPKPQSTASTEKPAPEVAAAPPPAPRIPIPPAAAVRGRGLLSAPYPTLIEPSSFEPLPRIGPAGREPWQAYARPVDEPDDRPRVAVILSGLGLSSAATEAAVQGLPGEVTLAFQPFADNIQQWVRLARAAGHEVLLNLPMEPVKFPENDPRPGALFVTLSSNENEERLRWALSRVTGYVGVVNHMGSRLTTSRDVMKPILAEIKARGLLYVEARSSARSVATVMASEMRVPRAINNRFLDAREVSRVTIDAHLTELERIAKDAGVSIAIGQAFPVTIERLREWTKTLDSKGLALVPVSALVNVQADR